MESSPSQPPASEYRRQCLLVDDEESVRFVTERILRRSGWDVTCCADGSEALSWLQRAAQPPHCIVTDIMLTGLTGPAWVALALDQHLLPSTIPVCFVSGYHDPALLRDVTPRLTRWCLLEKPVRMKDFSSTLADLVAG